MDLDDILPGAFIAFVFSGFGAWATSVIVSLKHGDWLLGLVGLFVPPIGIVHGYGIWLGVW